MSDNDMAQDGLAARAARPSRHEQARHKPAAAALRIVLTAVTAVGLGYDAYAHFDLAGNYDAIKTSALSQGDLFRIEGVGATLAALAVLARPRRYTALIAFAVATVGLAAVLAYRYYNIKGIGPFPDMYEPVWYPEKTRSAYAEGGAAVAAAALFGLSQLAGRRRDRTGHDDAPSEQDARRPSPQPPSP